MNEPNVIEGFILVPVNPTLAMLEAGWKICGTELSSMQPNPTKIAAAQEHYKAMLDAAKHVYHSVLTEREKNSTWVNPSTPTQSSSSS